MKVDMKPLRPVTTDSKISGCNCEEKVFSVYVSVTGQESRKSAADTCTISQGDVPHDKQLNDCTQSSKEIFCFVLPHKSSTSEDGSWWSWEIGLKCNLFPLLLRISVVKELGLFFYYLVKFFFLTTILTVPTLHLWIIQWTHFIYCHHLHGITARYNFTHLLKWVLDTKLHPTIYLFFCKRLNCMVSPELLSSHQVHSALYEKPTISPRV